MPTEPSLLSQIAASLDAPRALAPHLPALFAGLSALGSMPRTTARLLADQGLRPRHRVLDLACGKGAVAIELAARTGCRITGLDAFPPFIDAARDLAARRTVAHLCTFRVANLSDPKTLPHHRFDAAMMLGLDPLAEAAPFLRTLIHPGGLYLIDDCFRNPRHPRSRDFPHIPTRTECDDLIASLGDTALATHIPTPSATRRLNASLYRRLAVRARELRRDYPDLAPSLREFLARQRGANAVLTGPLRPAIWVIRRGRGA